MLATIALVTLLAAAVWADVTSGRIPNRVTLAMLLSGTAISFMPDGVGPGQAGGGFVLGLLSMLPLYRIRAIGAGDAKLMAAAGTYLGVAGILIALLYAFALGGALTLGYAAKKRALPGLLGNLRIFAYSSLARIAGGNIPTVEDMPLSQGRVPYAIAIAGGVLLQFSMQHFSGAAA